MNVTGGMGLATPPAAPQSPPKVPRKSFPPPPPPPPAADSNTSVGAVTTATSGADGSKHTATVIQHLMNGGWKCHYQDSADDKDGSGDLGGGERDGRAILGETEDERQFANDNNDGAVDSPWSVSKMQPFQEKATVEEDEAHIRYEETVRSIPTQAFWEEEATPDQTAFGKKLLFARKDLYLQRGGDDCDTLSTSSERGTVIDQSLLEDDDESPFSPPIEQSNTYSEPIWDNELSLPILEMHPSKDLSKNEEKKGAEGEDDDEQGVTPVKANVSIKPEKSTHSILSMAIRRIGSGFGHRGGSISAPNTPRERGSPLYGTSSPSPYTLKGRGITSPRQTEETQYQTPSSFLLRSPGSAAFQLASSNPDNRRILSPRFSYRDFHRSSVSKIDEEEIKEISQGLSAFKIARSCFSFDAYDTSMDDMFEVSVSNTDGDFRPYQHMEHRLEPHGRPLSLPNDLLPPRDDRHMERIRESGGSLPASLRGSASWDVGGTTTYAPPFRTSRSSSNGLEALGFSSPFRQNSRHSSNHGGYASDVPTPRGEAKELQPTDRIEIEREDALDILSCLVERGVSFNKPEEDLDLSTQPCVNINIEELDLSTIKSSSELTSVMDELKEMLQENTDEDVEARNRRLAALDELMRSHHYAVEMRRASQSALHWLNSLGRSVHNTSKVETTGQDSNVGDESQTTHVAQILESDAAAATKVSDDMDLLTVKATLHSTQMEVKEKSLLADRLNEELAKCRAEIGRLRSTSQSLPFKSPNRSILDESDELSADDEVERSFETTSPIVGIDDSGFFQSSYLDGPRNLTGNVSNESVVTIYRAALEQANDQILKLHEELQRLKSVGERQNIGNREPTLAEISPKSEKSDSPGNKEHRTINVRMLDGENFVTEWTDLIPPLPPPPDHVLRSPIVTTVLEQWSGDPILHDSLFEWMDQVLNGRDPIEIPPLTLSSLGHQVRDGFILHVLPLLLRRADIRVDVKTRAHRTTTYDLSVAVESLRPFEGFMESDGMLSGTRGNIGSSATRSTRKPFFTPSGSSLSSQGGKSTEERHSSGLHEATSRLSYDEMVENGIGLEHTPGIMSALGGALGGLLTRRKQHPYEATLAPGVVAGHATPYVSHLSHHHHQQLPPQQQHHPFSPVDVPDEHQPYHRVVSAPPGRIGVTFVEYRGHAMVSDVSSDSPLGGWIFPSDILIAIDELPVSGMRVRDIIKVLKDRSNRQRALRVISSQAMSEFSLNTSGLDAST